MDANYVVLSKDKCPPRSMLEIVESHSGYDEHMELQIGSFRGMLHFMRQWGIL